jgi:hypothetical protein
VTACGRPGSDVPGVRKGAGVLVEAPGRRVFVRVSSGAGRPPVCRVLCRRTRCVRVR